MTAETSIRYAVTSTEPDSAHGFLSQHHDQFAADVHAFLEEDD